MKARAVIVVAVALLVAAVVVRVAFVAAYGSSQPARAAALWPHHPKVIFATGFEQVGQLAASGRAVDKALVHRLVATAAKAPLAAEPYLVRGVEAQQAGNETLAMLAFLEARRRDPRSVAARYFLADHYLRTGQTQDGLAEISTLARLIPQSLAGIAPHLAAYARSPGAAPKVKAMLGDYPELEPLLLNALAADAANDRLALYLWSGRGGDNAYAWQDRLIGSMIEARRYRQAQLIWNRFNPAARRQGQLVDAGFEARARPPFGWTLASGPAGVVEPQEGGRLHIVYYGRDDLVFASQLLLLQPGTHRLSMRINGGSPAAKSLAWRLRCLPSSNEIANFGLAGAKNGVLTATFSVPAAGCTAQRLDLAGTAPEFPEQADVTIAGLRLESGAAR